jgi:DNA-binding transcriptional ArsR family regulator
MLKYVVFLRHKNIDMTKSNLFEEELQGAARVFKSFASPARLSILEYLAKTKVCMTGDISKELPLSRTTVNQHLVELKKLNLIKGEIEGTKKNYCLNQEGIAQAKATINKFLSQIENINNSCKNT